MVFLAEEMALEKKNPREDGKKMTLHSWFLEVFNEDRLERAHRWVTKVMKELGSLAQEERQFSQPFSRFCSALRKKRLRGDLFTKLQHLKGGYKGDGDPFYNESHGKDKG